MGRALPLVRSFTSVAAGIAGVRPVLFGVLSLAGTVVYAAAVTSIGYGLGSAWHRITGDLSVAGYVIGGVVVAALVVFVITRLRQLRREAEPGAEVEPGASTEAEPSPQAGPDLPEDPPQPPGFPHERR